MNGENFSIDADGVISINPPFLRTPYNYDTNEASLVTGLDCKDPSLAQQQFAEEADINTLIKRFGVGAQMPENPRMPAYGDFTGVSDYRSAIEAARKAEADFMALPAQTRAYFENDPQRLLIAAESGDRKALEESGILKPSPVPAAPTPSATPPAPPA